MRHLLIIVALMGSAFGTCHTVSPAGTGTKSGADWNNTMQWSAITFTRGDSYYLQVGSYGSRTFSVADSGTSIITIKAVTSSDNCTSTGFNAGTMVGQAVFTAPLSFATDYWVLTGVYRSTATGNPMIDWVLESGYGFKINNQVAQSGTSINGGSGYSGATCGSLSACSAAGMFVHDITLSYLDINGAHTKTDAGDIDNGIDFEGGSYNIDYSHIYLHDAAVPFFLRGNHADQAGGGYWFGTGDSNTVEYTYVQNNYSSPTYHSEACSCSEGLTNFTWRYNVTDQIGGVGSNGATAHLGTASGADYNSGNGINGPWFIYGNIFTCSSTNANQNCAVGDGALAIWDASFTDGTVYFLNNTIYDIGPHSLEGAFGIGLAYTTPFTTMVVENNLFYDNDPMSVIANGTTSYNGATFSPGVTWGYNAYFDTPSAGSSDADSHKQVSATNPFNNSGACCSLTSDTMAGINTGSVLAANNTDMLGVTRGANGTIDRGALQISGASPIYSARTDLNVAKLGPIVPNVGNLVGAGTAVTDDMGNNLRTLRLSDANFDSASNPNDSYTTAASGSGDMNIFSKPFTYQGHTHALMCIQESGTLSYFVDVDELTLAITRPYTSGSAHGGLTGPAATCSWGHTNYKAYFIHGNTLCAFDFTNWVSGSRLTAPSCTVLFDFTEQTNGLPNYNPGVYNCLPSSAYGSPTWVDDTSSTNDDQLFASAWSVSGSQGTGFIFAVYKVGSGCWAINTETGVVTGDWGTTGTATLPVAGGWFIHSQKLSHNDTYGIIDCTGNGNGCTGLPFIVQIGTLNVFAATQTPNSGGHTVTGNLTFINNYNSPIGQQAKRSLTSVSSPSNLYASNQIPSGIGVTFDLHQGWNNVDALDSLPFFQTTWRPSQDTVCGVVSTSGQNVTLLAGHVFTTSWTGSVDIGGQAYTISTVPTTGTMTTTTAPPTTANTTYCYPAISFGWIMEVQAVVPGTGVTYRFGHCNNTGSDARFFTTQECIGEISQDGNLYAFTSDWLGTLGSSSGGTTCTTTSNCRSDVFVTQLQPFVVAPVTGVGATIADNESKQISHGGTQ